MRFRIKEVFPNNEDTGYLAQEYATNLFVFQLITVQTKVIGIRLVADFKDVN